MLKFAGKKLPAFFINSVVFSVIILKERDFMATARKHDISIDLNDFISESAYISYKDRKKLKAEHFLDQKNRSFPIRPGHECADLNASLHRLGTYKGHISRDELHSKIISMMKEHGCPLPEADKTKNNLV